MTVEFSSTQQALKESLVLGSSMLIMGGCGAHNKRVVKPPGEQHEELRLPSQTELLLAGSYLVRHKSSFMPAVYRPSLATGLPCFDHPLSTDIRPLSLVDHEVFWHPGRSQT